MICSISYLPDVNATPQIYFTLFRWPPDVILLSTFDLLLSLTFVYYHCTPKFESLYSVGPNHWTFVEDVLT